MAGDCLRRKQLHRSGLGQSASALRPYPMVYPLQYGWEEKELPEPRRTSKEQRRAKEAIRESCIRLDD